MEEDTKSLNRSDQTLHVHKKHKDSIPYRIEEITSLLKGKELEPLVDFARTDTEYYSKEDEQNCSNIVNLIGKKFIDVKKLMNSIGCRLEYKKSGTTGHTFRGYLTGNKDMEFGVKVCAYPKREKYGSINDVQRPENVEVMMLRLLSYFIVTRQTPHIALPIGTFNTDIKEFVGLIEKDYVEKDNVKYKDFEENYKKGEYYDDVSVLISEWANRGDFLEFIKKRYKKFSPTTWKVFFFQILSVLAVIQSKFPSFRHNDLKANNILVHKIDRNDKKFNYKINGKHYAVPNIKYQIKLWDFDFSCIPNIVNNKKVSVEWTKKINVTPEQNRYYDMHYFFNTLIKKGFFPQFMEDESIPQDAKDFVNRIVPDKFKKGDYVHERGRILINEEYLTPQIVLETDPYFEEFRIYETYKPVYKLMKIFGEGEKEKICFHEEIDLSTKTPKLTTTTTQTTVTKKKNILDFLNHHDKKKNQHIVDPKDLLISVSDEYEI